MRKIAAPIIALLCVLLVSRLGLAAELVTLSPENYEEYCPRGKEVEAIFGDYVLRNDRIVAVVGNPDLVSGRSSGRWGKHQVKGAVLDLTRRDSPNDQLNAFWPGPLMHRPDAPQQQEHFPDEALTARRPGRSPRRGVSVTLKIPAYEQDGGRRLDELAALPPSRRRNPNTYVEVRYTLADGWDYLLVEVVYKNPTGQPVRPKTRAMLRTDGAWESGPGFGRRLFWSYNRWWGQAYGVLAQGHRLEAKRRPRRENHLSYVPPEGRAPVIEPGGEFRITRRLIPGRNLFGVMTVAARLLDRPLRRAELTVRDPDGAVRAADVTARIGGEVYAAGRTDAEGRLEMNLPPKRCVLRVEAIGRPAKTVKLPAGGDHSVEVELSAPGCVEAEITDGAGEPLPCKVQFLGRKGTPDPFFFPATGERLVRNLIHAPHGRFRRAVPPGAYRVIVTRGPEYGMLSRDITLTRGETAVLEGSLERTVDTPGWVSADFHNHSTVSAETNLFYVYPYSWNPGVDGDSCASQRGRVLNLLCEGIEFAPPTEHNTVSSYAPHLEALEAEDLLATCPGIGLSAGRRHTLTHQNAFPVPYRPGRQDGGALQRPEHCNQITWLREWPGGEEMLIQVNVPRGQKLRVRPEMDVLDVEELAPLFAEKPDPGAQNRILEWIEVLNQGYRLPGVVGSGRFDNHHGSGAVRNYVKSPTDRPSDIRTADIVRAARRGHVLMTTGPFLEVTAETADGRARADVGGELPLEKGPVQFHVTVRCPERITAERVMVLVDGQKRPELDLRRETGAEGFQSGVTGFKRTLTLELEQDAHIIVGVQGHGPNLRRRSADGRETIRHYAVANPIYVDVGGDGFQPHSPFDDRCELFLKWRRKPLAQKGSRPGIVRAVIRNRGKKVARDTISLQSDPPGCIRVVGEQQKAYTVGPGAETTVDFRVAFTDRWLERGLPAITLSYIFHRNPKIRVPRSPVGVGRKADALRIQCHHPAKQLPPADTLDRVPELLKSQTDYPLWRRDNRFGTVRFALAGEKLAVHARVRDASPRRNEMVRESSSLEVFAADRGESIGQVILLPQIGDAPSRAFQQVEGRVIAAPDVKLQSKTTPKGYEIAAFVPLSLLPVEPTDRIMRLEFRTRTHLPDGELTHGTVFQSGAPDRDNLQFGSILIADRVAVQMEVLSPPLAGPAGKPGRVRLALHNTGDTEADDELTLAAIPRGAIRISGEPTPRYTLNPGDRTTIGFDVEMAEGFSGNHFQLHVPPTTRREIVRSPWLKLAVQARRPARLPAVPDLDGIPEALARRHSYRFRAPKGKYLGRLRCAAAGGKMALHAVIRDPRPRRHTTVWKGSCIEVFGSLPGKEKIGQVFLAPAADGEDAAGFQATKIGIEPADRIAVRTRSTEGGYELTALIPLHMLALEDARRAIRCEFQLTVSRAPTGKGVRRATLFGSRLAYTDNRGYARLYIDANNSADK